MAPTHRVLFADAVEQIDEGPRLAIRAAGGSKSQEFWSGVVPQALPAWIAVRHPLRR